MKTKKILISGFAFGDGIIDKLLKWGESHDMERLAREARKGWIVKDMKGMSYVLEQQEPQDIIYGIDYSDDHDDDYFEVYAASGWQHVGSIDYIHLFKAPSGTRPMHTNLESRATVLEREMKRYGRYSLVTVPACITLMLLNEFFTGPSTPVWNVALFALLLVSLIPAVFTFLPFLGYWNRLRNVRKLQI